MKITKFVHSCLTIETDGLSILIDPGGFSFSSHLLNINSLRQLDYIVITHEHPDHYDEHFLRLISKRFSHAQIITNEELLNKIAKLNLPNPLSSGSQEKISVFEARHEPLPLDDPNVPNIGVHIADRLTCPGDSYDFKHTRDVLALPITGPFASYKQALDVVVELKPKVVLPLHDWEWHKAARHSRYSGAKEFLKTHDIEFIELENAKSVEI